MSRINKPMIASHEQQPISQNSKNLASLTLCLLLCVSICLTAFNFYLFVWIWSNFNPNLPGAFLFGVGGPSAGSRQASNLLRHINLFAEDSQEEEGVTKFSQKLISEKMFGARTISGTGSYATQPYELRLSTSKELHAGSADHSPAGLVISGPQSSLSFANGLIVRGLAGGDNLQTILCSENFCQLRSARIKLTGSGELNLANKSIYTPLLMGARRLHSGLQKLQLLSTRSLKLEAKSELQMRALDAISIGSRNSSVIIKAKTIDLGGRLIEFNGGKHRRRRGAYKLCICLADDRAAQQLNGRIFAVANELKCAQFTQNVCSHQSSDR